MRWCIEVVSFRALRQASGDATSQRLSPHTPEDCPTAPCIPYSYSGILYSVFRSLCAVYCLLSADGPPSPLRLTASPPPPSTSMMIDCTSGR